MTGTQLESLKALDKPILVPADVAPLLGCDPYNITLQARADPAKLGFPVAVIGNRTKIPKDGFIQWYEWNNELLKGESENEN